MDEKVTTNMEINRELEHLVWAYAQCITGYCYIHWSGKCKKESEQIYDEAKGYAKSLGWVKETLIDLIKRAVDEILYRAFLYDLQPRNNYVR